MSDGPGTGLQCLLKCAVCYADTYNGDENAGSSIIIMPYIIFSERTIKYNSKLVQGRASRVSRSRG